MALGLVVAALAGSASFGQQTGDPAKQRAEETADYYRKWLQEDVVYIVTDAEKAVFESLGTDEEREQFIEQFWYRRDPDPRTPANEFKEEHYRRIAYANERFTSGVPGWKTDRGRIYIIHGPPAEIETHRSGESYQRPSHEGGGFTSTHPFEIWRYREIEGVGNDVELEFVDPTGSGEFRLALTPWEKDRLLVVPGAGLTDAESFGLARREDHPYFKPYNRDRYAALSHREKDDPFTRYQTLAKVQRPQAIKYNDLKELVDVRLGFQNLAFRVDETYIRLNQQNVLTPVTLEIDNRDLTFQPENGALVARVAVYGIITSITNRIVAEFDHELSVSYPPDGLEAARAGRSVFQKTFNLDASHRYRLDVIVKDLASGNIGAVRQALTPPAVPEDVLSPGPLILSDSVVPLPPTGDPDEMFVIGDLKIRPNLKSEFPADALLNAYFQVYNPAIDQTTQSPALTARFRVLRGEKQIKYWSEQSGESVLHWSPRRVSLLRRLPLTDLAAGSYTLEIEVEDRVSRQRVQFRHGFAVTAGPTASSSPD